jgi:hypothetical protein
MAMTLVSTVTVGSGGAASIEFTGIAGTGKDLLLLVSARTNRTELNDVINVTLNDDSATNYAVRRLEGGGASASSANFTAGFFRIEQINGNTSTSNTFGNAQCYISNYSTTAAKSIATDVVTENNAATSWQTISAASWSGTAAITKISMTSGTSNSFLQHTTASLYIIS